MLITNLCRKRSWIVIRLAISDVSERMFLHKCCKDEGLRIKLILKSEMLQFRGGAEEVSTRSENFLRNSQQWESIIKLLLQIWRTKRVFLKRLHTYFISPTFRVWDGARRDLIWDCVENGCRGTFSIFTCISRHYTDLLLRYLHAKIASTSFTFYQLAAIWRESIFIVQSCSNGSN